MIGRRAEICVGSNRTSIVVESGLSTLIKQARKYVEQPPGLPQLFFCDVTRRNPERRASWRVLVAPYAEDLDGSRALK
jgi:hypothetical protein